MPLSKTNCSHCGTLFGADDSAVVYSIRVDSKGNLLEVLDGELVPGALHYCSHDCMFRREQGVTPDDDTIFNYLDLVCESQ
jgi:hypothetical protein